MHSLTAASPLKRHLDSALHYTEPDDYGKGAMMRITSIELFQVLPRWLFLKMTTDDGLVGWGEPIVEGKAATVQAAVEEMADVLIGVHHDRDLNTAANIDREGMRMFEHTVAAGYAETQNACGDE
jgi:L-alanine-DL-glutamate epimerase-like enolase superfamily enzyme